MATPVDGYRVPTDVQRDFEGQTYLGTSGTIAPTAVQAVPAAPIAGAVAAPGFKL
jgi:hypothetical protein